MRPSITMTVKSRRIFGLLLIAICFSSLRCKEGCTPPSIDMAPELLRYIENYRSGNWWEYRNQNGNTETLRIVSLSDTFAAYPSTYNNAECKDRERKIYFGCNGIAGKKGVMEWGGIGDVDEGFSHLTFVRTLTTTSSGYITHTGYITYAPETRTYTSLGKLVQLIGSMQVGNNTFQQVLPIMLRTSERDTARIWVAPNVGIVQYTFDGDTFRLVNWRIQ